MLAGRAAGGGTTDEMPLPASTPGPVVLDGGGVLTVQVVLDGARFDDVVGPRFVVVVRHAAATAGEGVRWWTDRGAATLDAEAHPDLAIVLDRAGADAVDPPRSLSAVGRCRGARARRRVGRPHRELTETGPVRGPDGRVPWPTVSTPGFRSFSPALQRFFVATVINMVGSAALFGFVLIYFHEIRHIPLDRAGFAVAR